MVGLLIECESLMSFSANVAAIAPQSSVESQLSIQRSEATQVRFSPESGSASPLDQIGSDIAGTLRSYADRRTEFKEATREPAGPASVLESVKSELLAGPASLSPAAGADFAAPNAEGPARDMQFTDAMEAMARTFDHAIETQLIVQSSAKVSSSATSLLRAQ